MLMLTVLLVYPGSALRRQHRRHHPDRRLFGHRLYSSRSRRLLYHQAGRGRRQRQQVVLSYHLFCPFYFIKVSFLFYKSTILSWKWKRPSPRLAQNHVFTFAS